MAGNVSCNRHVKHKRIAANGQLARARHSCCNIYPRRVRGCIMLHCHRRQAWKNQDDSAGCIGEYCRSDPSNVKLFVGAADRWKTGSFEHGCLAFVCHIDLDQVTGIGFGAISATAPNWQSECSKAAHRGAVVILESLFISAGLATSAWIALGMSFTSGSVSWRFPLALSGLFAIIVFATVTMLPESPRWLLKHGRVEEAQQIIAALDGLPEDDPQVLAEVKEISESIARAGQGSFKDVFTMGDYRLFNRACLACAGQMFQQMVGHQTTTIRTAFL